MIKLVDFLIQEAQSRVGGGCDDPDCDCGGGGNDHGGGTAVTG